MDSVHKMIEKRAYELYLARGSVEGYASKIGFKQKKIKAELEKKKSQAGNRKTC
jgi:hypothetical protein